MQQLYYYQSILECSKNLFICDIYLDKRSTNPISMCRATRYFFNQLYIRTKNLASHVNCGKPLIILIMTLSDDNLKSNRF